MWGQGIWGPRPIWVSDPRPRLRREKHPRMNKEGPKLLRGITEDRLVLDEPVSWKEKAAHHSKQPSQSSQNKRTNTGGQLWGHGGGAIIEEAVTSALNARNWQSSCINEGMTPEQCHLVCCNSQQVEDSTGWDKYSSSDLHDQQMDGQDEWSRRIYNNRDLTRGGRR